MMIDIDIADFVEDISVIVDYIPDKLINKNQDIVINIPVRNITDINDD